MNARMECDLENSVALAVAEEIRSSPTFHRFIQVLREYKIETICDSHAHVSSGRNDLLDGVAKESINELPELPFTISDINRLYDALFHKEGINYRSVVFDTPLGAYDLVKRNHRLLNDLLTPSEGESWNVVPFAVVTPDMQGYQIEEFVERGARGFKMTPRTTSPLIKRGTISDITLAEMLNPEALRIADDHRLPLVVHLPQLVVSPRMRPSLRDELAHIASTYPNLKIILAHLGQAQTPAKIEHLLEWLDRAGFTEIIWMDISAVTVPSVLEIAFASDVRLLFGTDIDFSLTERGKYIMFKYANGQRVLAKPEDRGTVITALVSTSFGNQLKEFVNEEGIDLDSPLLLFQFEGILKAVAGLQQKGKSRAEIKSILENLFFRNAELLLRV